MTVTAVTVFTQHASARSVVAVSGQTMAASLSKNAFSLARSKAAGPLRSSVVTRTSASTQFSQIHDCSRP